MDFGMFGWWVVVGVLAGWLTGFVMKDGGYGLVGDMVLGLVGSVVGGLDRPGRLRGRGDIPDGVRRLRRGGRDHRPAQVVAHRAPGNVILALRVTRSSLDLVTRRIERSRPACFKR